MRFGAAAATVKRSVRRRDQLGEEMTGGAPFSGLLAQKVFVCSEIYPLSGHTRCIHITLSPRIKLSLARHPFWIVWLDDRSAHSTSKLAIRPRIHLRSIIVYANVYRGCNIKWWVL